MKPVRIGLAIPLQGPAGIFGPSCETVASLAAAQFNDATGILGREVVIEVIDAGGSAEQARHNVMDAVRTRRVDAITGWHISSIRERLAPALASCGIPYFYTSLHEGAQEPGMVSVGETPTEQVIPGMSWLSREYGVKRWAIVGSDYIWPHSTTRVVQQYVHARGDLEIVYESFSDYGCRDFTDVLNRLAHSGAQGVVMLLVGRDAVLFNRQFALAGLHGEVLRFTPLMEENMLLASGRESTQDLYVAAAYFNTLVTQSALDFAGAYGREFGFDAPALNNMAESCFEGILAFAATAERARASDAQSMFSAVDEGLCYEGPRGPVALTGTGARQRVHLARAHELQFDVLTSLEPVS